MTELEFTPLDLELRWLVMPPDARCSICDKPFSYPEWLDRHTDSRGKDCHDECCDVCAEDSDEDPVKRGAFCGPEYQPYNCPNCGWMYSQTDNDDPSRLERKDVRKFGGIEDPDWAMKWTEVHQCPNCSTIWEYPNANY